LSEIPFVKDFPFRYGEAAEVSPRVRRVIANNPGPFTFAGTGTYLVGRPGASDLAIIDPGPDDPAHLESVRRAVGAGRVTRILVTHAHRDHSAGARRFAEAFRAPVSGAGPAPSTAEASPESAVEEGLDRAFSPDAKIADGDVFEGEGWTLRAAATPGHLADHVCFALDEDGALFTGDHVMGWSTTVIAPPDGRMGDYFDSLEKLLARDDRIYFPTHGAPIERPASFVRAIRAHRRMRDGQILDHLLKGRLRIAEMLPAMYAGLDRRLYGAASLNILAHLIRLVDIGAVECDGPPTARSLFRLSRRHEI
jgi:glyoxylase-like metal-dependent hydrolase (beta-lactamase superfamily II)